MKVRRYSCDEVDENEAFSICSGSLFGSIEFASVWEAIGGKAVFWVAEEDNEIVGVMPSVEFRSHPFKRLQAMPDGCYCRFVCKTADKKLISEAKEKILVAIGNSSYAKCFIYDYFNEFENPANFQEHKISTQVIDISSPDWEPADAKLFTQIKKAESSALNIREFNGATDFDGFLKLVDKTEHRHGQKVRYPPEIFAALELLHRNNKNIIWRWAEIEGTPVASHIRLIENKSCLNWQSYSDKSYTHLKANQLMTYKLAKSLSLEGVKYMNLGGSPEGAESLEKYKKRWGGEVKTYSCYSYKSLLGKLF